jgi:hypothetical protein
MEGVMTTSSRDEDPGQPPTDVSKPVGDAIPAPIEPGLDQPLPPKGRDDDPLGDPEPVPGVPPPNKSDFA